MTEVRSSRRETKAEAEIYPGGYPEGKCLEEGKGCKASSDGVLLPWRSLGYIHIPTRDQTAGHGNSNETVSPGNGQAEENIQEKRTDALLDPEH